MDIENLSDQEAKEILSRNSAKELLIKYSQHEIGLIVNKAKNIKHDVPPPPKVIEIKPTTENKVTESSNTKHKSPGVMQTAKNFGAAMIESAKTGFKMVPKEVYEQRLNICKACPHWEPSGIPHCRICNCTTAKHKLASSKCPLNPPKWNSLK